MVVNRRLFIQFRERNNCFVYKPHRSQRPTFPEERERDGRVWETRRESLAMAESIDAVSLDMEKIYLGGKVRPLLQDLIFQFFFFSLSQSFCCLILCFGFWLPSSEFKLIDMNLFGILG